jgi:hypothetical protein
MDEEKKLNPFTSQSTNAAPQNQSVLPKKKKKAFLGYIASILATDL